ncbi:DUF302 domain-containing protein [Marichromatium bheemlicum]|uniref:DUF302 domain-containing protein n=1 Tax=Marichromatium bheemlicum TaxID=365339 RepID=A0ABX1I6V7_9GAMM|nr:DUF302 domain-containing protein [Marichromatium bheemlicum]NKN32911.1 DUF302 domain-containing protein [Marichromatium bheemlicum]
MSPITRALCVLVLLCTPLSSSLAAGDAVVHRAETSFEAALDGLRAAILERGLYINNVLDLAEMFARTAEDLGFTEPVYGEARSVEFCSAVLSREMMREDPTRIVNCPFVVSLYTLPDDPATVHAAYRAIPAELQAASPVMREVAELLDDLARAALAW